MIKDEYKLINEIKEKYKIDTESEQGRFKCRLLRLILINEYYKSTYIFYALNFPSMGKRKPYFDDLELIEPYQSFRNDIKEIMKSYSILNEFQELTNLIFRIYSNLHYKFIKPGEKAVLGILINYHQDYPKFISDTIVVQN